MNPDDIVNRIVSEPDLISPIIPYPMTSRIIPQIVSLSLFACAAYAEDEAPLPVCTIDPVEVEIPVFVPDPVVFVCPVVDEVAVKPEVEKPEVVSEVVDGEVVTCDVGEVRHYSGSEVERGGGDVDPVIMYSTGAVNLGGETGGGSLIYGNAGSGIAAVAALKVDIADLAATARELQVLDTAGDIVISD